MTRNTLLRPEQMLTRSGLNNQIWKQPLYVTVFSPVLVSLIAAACLTAITPVALTYLFI